MNQILRITNKMFICAEVEHISLLVCILTKYSGSMVSLVVRNFQVHIWELLTKFSGAYVYTFIRTVLHTKHSGVILIFFYTNLAEVNVDTCIRKFQEQTWVFHFKVLGQTRTFSHIQEQI